jgi:hypothetical protein
MDHEEVGRFWNANADSWTKLARAGYDGYRDYLNTPAFFAMLPDVDELSGLDIGCGEGHNEQISHHSLLTSSSLELVGCDHHRASKRRK